MEYKRNITELSFHTAQRRAGPAILAGLEEGVRSDKFIRNMDLDLPLYKIFRINK